ncbi:sensor histidine kinase [Actinacidiphila acididurans]|uniref:Signal transduction histidine-protein kinase/phosphatase MprB n=1 Tax=Actinacidiphila acididurans TaxID=2784346 RepID=A0ABS2TV16_9ACTN|nr:HAMP domain-containing sensor histidine kinase [Actinacidiphila acididurans]MBM9507174.1 HAMP domain-containing histidine kinase [Actinacidiphila acididurans]
MRNRLLPLLIALMAGVLLALGFPLAASEAASQQQRVVVDRIDDTTRFAALAQFVTARDEQTAVTTDDVERLHTLRTELDRYQQLYGIRAGVFYRDRTAMATAPANWRLPTHGELSDSYYSALLGRRAHDPNQIWPWQHRTLAISSPIVRDGDVVAVVVTDSPTGALRTRILRGWLVLAAGELAAMAVAVLFAVRLTAWVLLPVARLDRVTHDIATGRMTSRVEAAGGPPELRRLILSFNEMADNVEEVLDQQRAFVANASHQLRNPLSALLLRVELLGLELPAGHTEAESVKEEGHRLAQVLDDLLGLAVAESGAESGDSHRAVTDIVELVRTRVAAWRPAGERAGTAVEFTEPPDPGAATGWADPVALSSALDAVMDNAIKFTAGSAKDGAGAAGRNGEGVSVRIAADDDHVLITVADSGPGLTDEELARIGDRFWRSNRHQNVQGSGLGLSIARTLIGQGGGAIVFDRREPHGLEVTLKVPRRAPVRV